MGILIYPITKLLYTIINYFNILIESYFITLINYHAAKSKKYSSESLNNNNVKIKSLEERHCEED